MKITDDYRAKFRLWAAHPQILPAPPPPRLPKFPPQRFASHEEMNRWKADLLRRLAREGPDHG